MTRITHIAALLLALLLGAFTATATARAQQTWTMTDTGYPAFNGKAQFLSGANYIPSRDWYLILKNWTPQTVKTVEADMQAMRDISVKIIRFPIIWTLIQDDDGKIDTQVLDHLDELLTIAHRNGIHVQVEYFTGGVDGATLLPKWAEGDIFSDPKILQREKELVTAVATKLKNNPGLFGYDFGNEINFLHRRLERGLNIKTSPRQMRDWMALIAKTSKDADPARMIAPGYTAERSKDALFNIWDVAATTDFASVHAYPYFDATIKTDPWLGQRTLYDLGYNIAFADMAGKPVMVQENGFSEWWVGSEIAVAKALRLSMAGAWAQGAIGFLWWGSHNNPLDFRIPIAHNATYSEPQVLEGGVMNELEYSEGLLDSENQPKFYGLEFKRWSDLLAKLGVDWKETLPIVYILQSDDTGKPFPDKKQLAAFTLAKQAHMNVKMWPDWKPIPADAAAVVIANYALNEEAKAHVAQYLNDGGTVYQSWFNDFAKDVAVADTAAPLPRPTFEVTFPKTGVPMRNTLPFFDGERLRVNVNELKIRNITSKPGPETRVLLSTMANKSRTQAQSTKSQPVYTETKVGKGKYYYLAANLEEALGATYNPWTEDNSDKIYGALRPAFFPVDIDSKFVELYIKERGGENNEKLLVLLNRSDVYQHVMVYSRQPAALQNYETGASLGSGREIEVGLKPGEVLIARMSAAGTQ